MLKMFSAVLAGCLVITWWVAVPLYGLVIGVVTCWYRIVCSAARKAVN